MQTAKSFREHPTTLTGPRWTDTGQRTARHGANAPGTLNSNFERSHESPGLTSDNHAPLNPNNSIINKSVRQINSAISSSSDNPGDYINPSHFYPQQHHSSVHYFLYNINHPLYHDHHHHNNSFDHHYNVPHYTFFNININTYFNFNFNFNLPADPFNNIRRADNRKGERNNNPKQLNINNGAPSTDFNATINLRFNDVGLWRANFIRTGQQRNSPASRCR